MALLPLRRLVYKYRVNARRPLALTTFLLALLLWAQASLTAHKVDTDAHVPGEQCEWCVAGNALGGALPTTTAVVLPITPAITVLPAVTLPTPALCYSLYRTRAPPLHFS